MKTLYILLIACALFGCKKSKKEDPQPTSRYKNPAAQFHLSGSGTGKSVILTFTIKDTLQAAVIKTWSKTVTYSTQPSTAILELPGLPETGKYYQFSSACYSSSCSTDSNSDFTGEIYIYRQDPYDIVIDSDFIIN
jgi:hypothetical protein